MNFKADDYLVHHGVKGMKWRKHKYKLVKGADGKYTYVYDDAQTARQARAEKKDKVVGNIPRSQLLRNRYINGTSGLTATYEKRLGPGLGDKDRVKSVTLSGFPGEFKQTREKIIQTEEKARKEKASAERDKRVRQAEANKEQVERRKQVRQAQEAKPSKSQVARQARAEEKDKVVGQMYPWHHKAYREARGLPPLTETVLRASKTKTEGPLQISQLRATVRTGRSGEQKQREEKRAATRDKKMFEDMVNAEKYKELEARAEESTARRKAAVSKDASERRVQQYLIKRTQEAAAIKRKKADEWRKADPSIESLGYSSNPYDTRATAAYDRGSRSTDGRYSKGRTSGGGVLPSEETRKRLRRNKRKKTVADVKRFINGLINR